MNSPREPHTKQTKLFKKQPIPFLSGYLQEIVYGGNDGIVTTFAMIAGFSAANISDSIFPYSYIMILLFGLINLFSASISMGLGNFTSTRADNDVYKSMLQKERETMKNNEEKEKKETNTLMMKKGFTQNQAQQITEIFSTNKKYWLEFMMVQEYKMNPSRENPYITAVTTIISFIVFGIIPLLPYIFVPQSPSAFLLSLSYTVIALILLGFVRWRATGISLIRSIGETLLIGGIASSIAYLIGTFFGS